MDATDEEQNTLLHIAAKGNHRDTIKLIIENRKAKDIDIRNAAGQKPIHVAAEFGHNRVMKFLIRNGAHINSRFENVSIIFLVIYKNLLILSSDRNIILGI